MVQTYKISIEFGSVNNLANYMKRGKSPSPFSMHTCVHVQYYIINCPSKDAHM